MLSTHTILSQLKRIFHDLTRHFGFVLKMENPYKALLSSPQCLITISLDRHTPDIWVKIIDPHDVDKQEYDHLIIMFMRFPNYPFPSSNQSGLEGEQLLIAKLSWIRETLLRCCSDLLTGEFGTLRDEGYIELSAYISSRMPIMINLPTDDPISVKFWRGDFSWVSDLQARERRQF